MAAQFAYVLQLQDLVETITHYRIGKACREVGHRSTFAQHLLHLGIHEHGAAGTQIARRQALACLIGEVGDIVTKACGKSGEERTTARGAGLVDLHAVDDTILHKNGLHVLTADVEDEADFGVDMMCREEMRNGLDDTMVELEGCLDEILAIARAARPKDPHTGIGRSEPGVEPLEPLLDRQDWIAAIGDIIIVDDTPLGAEHNDLGGGGTRIDAQKSIEDGDILARFDLHLTEILLERLRIGNQSVEVVGRELAARHPV